MLGDENFRGLIEISRFVSAHVDNFDVIANSWQCGSHLVSDKGLIVMKGDIEARGVPIVGKLKQQSL